MNCSTLWERAAGSPPNTSQVSLQCSHAGGNSYGNNNWRRCFRNRLARKNARPRNWVFAIRAITLSISAHGDVCWAEAPIKIARMTLTIKLDRNWSSFQLANSTPPLSVTDSTIAPSARMRAFEYLILCWQNSVYKCCLIAHTHTTTYGIACTHRNQLTPNQALSTTHTWQFLYYNLLFTNVTHMGTSPPALCKAGAMCECPICKHR